MNNINDMTDKQLNKTPWSETKMKKYVTVWFNK